MQIRVNPNKKRLKIAVAVLLLLVIIIGVFVWRSSAQNGGSSPDAATETNTTENSESPVSSEAPVDTPAPSPAPGTTRQAAPPEEISQPTKQALDSMRAERSKCKLSGGEWSSGYGVGGTLDGEAGCRHQ